jgi:hypothetical protein
MKKLLIISVISFLILVLLSAGIYMLIIGNPPQAKDYSCQEYSSDCELQKDRVLILPITLDSTTIDAYGDSINRGNNQWYIVSTKVHILVPVDVVVCIGGNINTGPQYTHNPSPAQILKDVSWGSDVRIDTIDATTLIPGLTKAAMVVCGANEVVHNGETVELAIAK